MINLSRLLRLHLGIEEAKSQVEKSLADREESRSLSDEVDRLWEENHITARVHAAFRGVRE